MTSHADAEDMDTDGDTPQSSIGSEPFEILMKDAEDGDNACTNITVPAPPVPAPRKRPLYPQLPDADSDQPAGTQNEKTPSASPSPSSFPTTSSPNPYGYLTPTSPHHNPTQTPSSPSPAQQSEAAQQAKAKPPPPPTAGYSHPTGSSGGPLPPLSYPAHPSDPLGVRDAGATNLDEQERESEPPQSEDREYRILLIGKTGNGKSSLGNTILGERKFAVGRGMFSTTREAQAFSAEVHGKRLKVIDTPDLTNLTLDRAEVQQRVSKWKELVDGEPDVIIQAVRCDVRYTKEEHEIYLQTKDLWRDQSIFRQRLMVAFTFGDLQDEDLKEELETVNEELKSVLSDARKRFVQVNNRARKEEKAQQQDEVFRVLNTVIEQRGQPTKVRKEIAVVLMGTTGHGKSSLGNLLIENPSCFPVATGPASVTKQACLGKVERAGMTLQIYDTPDLRNKTAVSRKLVLNRLRELTTWQRAVILFVVRCDVRFTSHEFSAYKDIKEYWGEGRVIVVFTFKDRLDYDLESLPKEQEELSKVLADKGVVWVSINSKVSAAENADDLGSLLGYIKYKASASGVLQERQGTIAAIEKKVTTAANSVVDFVNKTTKSGDSKSFAA